MKKTLRELLKTPGRVLVNISDAPYYIHDWNFNHDDDTVVFKWLNDGQEYCLECDLDEPPPESVFEVVKIETISKSR